MSEKQYFPVPLAHVTSPIAPALEPEPPAAATEPPREPFGMLDAEDLPDRLGIDAVTVLARDPSTIFVHWETTPAARERAGAEDKDAALVLRLATLGGPAEAPGQVIDEALDRDAGRAYLPAPYPGALIDAAIGVRRPDGGFTPIASAPRLRVPYATPEEGPVEWLEVPPAKTRGLELERPVPGNRGPAAAVAGAAQRGLAAATPASDAPTSPAVSSPPTSPARPPSGGR
jgi:hypothetical protein